MIIIETIELIQKITAAYHNFTVSEEKVKVWHEFLEPYKVKLVNRNLHKHIESKAFPPTISELIKRDENYEREYVPLPPVDLLADFTGEEESEYVPLEFDLLEDFAEDGSKLSDILRERAESVDRTGGDKHEA